MSEPKTENGWTVVNENVRYKVFGEKLAVWRAFTVSEPKEPACWIYGHRYVTPHVGRTTAEIDAMLAPQPEQVIRGERFTAYKHEGRTTYVDRDRSGGWRACCGGAYTVTATREEAEAVARKFVMKGGA